MNRVCKHVELSPWYRSRNTIDLEIVDSDLVTQWEACVCDGISDGLFTGIHLVTFFVPLLVAFLSESDGSVSSLDRRLHKVALKKLTDFGPQYPAEFRSVMQNRPDLRSRLERAIHSQNVSAAMTATATKSSATAESRPAPATSASIKLKLDFSNFAS